MSLGAPIVGVAEIYTSLTEDRPHRPARSAEDARAAFKKSCSSWYASHVIEALAAVLSAGTE